MTAARSASLIAAQRAISSSVRPQPLHSPLAASIVQTLMQGVWIGFIAAFSYHIRHVLDRRNHLLTEPAQRHPKA